MQMLRTFWDVFVQTFQYQKNVCYVYQPKTLLGFSDLLGFLQSERKKKWHMIQYQIFPLVALIQVRIGGFEEGIWPS